MFIIYVLTFILFVICIEIYRDSKSSKKKWAPGPICLPIIGSGIELGLKMKKMANFQILDQMSEKYGPIWGYFLGKKYNLIIDEFELAKEIFGMWDLRLAPDNSFITSYYKSNCGLIFSHGDQHTQDRRFSLKTLRKFGLGKVDTMEILLKREVQSCYAKLDDLIEKNNGVVSLNGIFPIYVVNILFSVLTGKKFSEDEENAQRLVSLVQNLTKLTQPATSLLLSIPSLRYVPYLTEFETTNEHLNKIVNYFKDVIREEKANMDSNSPQNFIQEFYSVLNNLNKSENDLDKVLTFLLIDLFFGGTDTTAVSLEWAFLYLLQNPRVYQKVSEELNSVVGKEQISFKHKNSLPYVEATMMEVFRMSFVFPIIARSPKSDCSVKGFFVPGGSSVFYNMGRHAMSESIWGDALNFRPERFISPQNTIINSEILFAFGIGKRKCVGEGFAKQIFFYFFTSLLQRYEMSEMEGLSQIRSNNGFTRSPAKFSIKIKIK